MLQTGYLQGANIMAFWQNPEMPSDHQYRPSSVDNSDLEAELPLAGMAIETTGATRVDKPHATRPKEIGGRDGPDPTRYGDWEKAGRCIDF
ncbi:hypothetical protein MnTg04_01574 [bacterium MnTg04]|nr:hypothetical protein MnTg04_01574 [bacterium MnTg04]